MPGLFTPPMPESDFAAMGDQGVDQGSGFMAGAGMDDKARGFVQNHQEFVLETNVERNVFGLRLGGRGFRHIDLDDLAGAQFCLGRQARAPRRARPARFRSGF